MTTQSNASCECSGYNTPNGNTVYTKNEKGLRPQKKNNNNNALLISTYAQYSIYCTFIFTHAHTFPSPPPLYSGQRPPSFLPFQELSPLLYLNLRWGGRGLKGVGGLILPSQDTVYMNIFLHLYFLQPTTCRHGPYYVCIN